MVEDLNCGLRFFEENARAIYNYEGSTYYFCSPECRDKFLLSVLDSGGCGNE